jgi:thioredoxin reductase
MMRRLKAAGAKMHPRTKVLEYRGDTVLVENEKGEQELLGPFDHVLFSMGTRAYNPFGEELAKFVPEVKIVGDAKEARRVVNATREGFDAAMEL